MKTALTPPSVFPQLLQRLGAYADAMEGTPHLEDELAQVYERLKVGGESGAAR